MFCKDECSLKILVQQQPCAAGLMTCLKLVVEALGQIPAFSLNVFTNPSAHLSSLYINNSSPDAAEDADAAR